jgi:hypothetical protein
LEGDPLNAVQAGGPVNGTLVLNLDGTFTYTPNADFSGVDSFSYFANDGNLDSDPAVVTIIVNAPTSQPPGVDPSVADSASETELEVDPPPADDEPPLPTVDEAAAAAPVPPAPAASLPAVTVMYAAPTFPTSATAPAVLEPGPRPLVYEVVESISAATSKAVPKAVVNTIPAILAPYDAGLLWNDMTELTNDIMDQADLPYLVAGSAAGLTGMLSVGYVIWTIRSGWLATSLLAQMPAWRLVDPLVVLDYLEETPCEEAEDDSIESMLDRHEPTESEAEMEAEVEFTH